VSEQRLRRARGERPGVTRWPCAARSAGVVLELERADDPAPRNSCYTTGSHMRVSTSFKSLIHVRSDPQRHRDFSRGRTTADHRHVPGDSCADREEPCRGCRIERWYEVTSDCAAGAVLDSQGSATWEWSEGLRKLPVPAVSHTAGFPQGLGKRDAFSTATTARCRPGTNPGIRLPRKSVLLDR
jgi:hypothetical protein